MSSKFNIVHCHTVSFSIIEKLVLLDESLKNHVWSHEMWSNELNSGLAVVSLFYQNEELAGFALWKVGAFGDVVDLLKIVIAPQFRRYGYGLELLKSGLQFISKYGVKKALLDVSVHNREALNLYKLLNFKILVERKAYYSNGENAFLMELNIT